MVRLTSTIKIPTIIMAVLLLAGMTASAGIIPWVVSFTGDVWATQYQGGRKIVQDSTGIYHVVYQAWTGNATVIEYVYSLNKQGTAWSPPVQIPGSSPGYIPAIAIDMNDILHVVWSDNVDIQYSTSPAVPPGTGWLAPPVNVSNNPNFASIMCSIDCDANFQIHVVWQEVDFTAPLADEILYSTAPGPGGPFTVPFNISNNPNESERPCVACPQNWAPGSIHVVWDEIGGGWPSFQIFHSAFFGGAWTPATMVSQMAPGVPDVQGLGACVAVDGNDNPHVTYSHWTLAPFSVCYNQGTFGGAGWTFGNTTYVAGTTQTYDVPNPTITIDTDGIIRLIWTDDASPPGPPPPPRQRTLYYSFYDAGFGAWRTPTSFQTLDYHVASYVYKNQMRGGYAVWTDGDTAWTNLQAADVPPVYLKLTGTPSSAPRGATLFWTVHLVNPTTVNQGVELWLELTAPIPPAPKARLYKVLPNYPPGYKSGRMRQKIPAGAPTGTYCFTVMAAWSPFAQFWDSDSFQVVIY